MELALFNIDGIMFLLRWLHIFFGVIWIGHLYYFNFVQGAFFAETDASTKSNAIQKLVPRALWWFRWGAMFTMLTGVTYLAIKGHRDGVGIFMTSWGISFVTGLVLGLLMWAYVWFVIWPNQKIVIQSATQVASGGQANPAAAAAGAKAGLASRHNTFFSIPMLFFMAAASHLPFQINPNANLAVVAGVVGVLILAAEVNALKGKTGPLTTIRGVITSGFIASALLYTLVEVLTK
ncbi:MAG: urate hydroxylase PuuD [Candidatus Melainabacteria bacterium]|nr:urate hydroxylase PuuD [Candidatus Melainabacteria bacterium]